MSSGVSDKVASGARVFITTGPLIKGVDAVAVEVAVAVAVAVAVTVVVVVAVEVVAAASAAARYSVMRCWQYDWNMFFM